MKNWLKISLMLSLFGFFKDFRPSEHFIYEFLIGPWRNVTEEEVQGQVYPIATYSYLAQLVLVFLITDLCRYKPLIIVLGLSGVTVFSMLLWTTSLLALQITEVVYGTLMATEVAYYTYMYAKVPKEKYQQVTAHTRAGILFGRFSSGIVGQLLISFEAMDFRQLTFISLGSLITATFWALFLPGVSESIYFHQPGEINEIRLTFQEKWTRAFKLLYHHFIHSYSVGYVVKWSIWWAMATCGFLLVQTYMQPLWQKINPTTASKLYNGAVEAILTILGALGAITAGFIETDWRFKGDAVLAICSLIEGGLLIIASQTHDIFLCYACYIIFGACFHFMITIATAEIAKFILEDSYGLVFGINTFLALSLNTVLIIVIVTDHGFGFEENPRAQYLFYGGYFMVIAIIFIIIGTAEWVRHKRNTGRFAPEETWLEKQNRRHSEVPGNV